MGDRDAGRARAIVREVGVEKLPIESLGWLLPVLSGDAGSSAEIAAVRRHLANRATEEAATASFATDYGEQGPYLLLHSNRRTDAVLLEALIADQPKNDLIPKLVEGLMAHRKAGRWGSTQENAFVLLALDRYFQTFEKIEPNFVARAWLGPQFAGEQKFVGRQTDRQHVDIPMADLFKLGAGDLTIAKEGKGRLYYRVGMRYAPTDLTLPPSDHGFVVDRVYEGAEDPKDVVRDKDGKAYFKRTLRFETPAEQAPFYLRAAAGKKIVTQSERDFGIDKLRLRLTSDHKGILRDGENGEVLIPLTLPKGRSTLTLEYQW
jgi:hypothetical protein